MPKTDGRHAWVARWPSFLCTKTDITCDITSASGHKRAPKMIKDTATDENYHRL